MSGNLKFKMDSWNLKTDLPKFVMPAGHTHDGSKNLEGKDIFRRWDLKRRAGEKRKENAQKNGEEKKRTEQSKEKEKEFQLLN